MRLHHLALIALAAIALSPTVGGFLFRLTLALPLVWSGLVSPDQLYYSINW